RVVLSSPHGVGGRNAEGLHTLRFDFRMSRPLRREVETMPKPYTIVEAPDGMLCEITVNADGSFSPRAWRPRRAPAAGLIVSAPLPMLLQRAVFSTGEAAMSAAYAVRRR